MNPTTPSGIRLQRRAKNAEAWGFLLLGAGIALWAWFALLLVLPYDAGGMCESRLFTDGPTAHASSSFRDACAAQRDWPEILGVLGLSVPVTVAGAVLHTSGKTSQRLSEHAAEIAQLKELISRNAS
ncbi:hypothetical protein OG302_03700 [Streptomyces sp. NBC_01283]|uniref:hypothetical protein n=1 Tax=Streptomyces sp. NBC_01283 TaxID=2903812 RepID=UPI00352DA48A|nr:hypothetical protein OG302_03700 [Streptomyces sp. NBC_01283]